MTGTKHRHLKRSGWLRAAILGANDGILSTASLIVGVAASHAQKESILAIGVAGCMAGAFSMAAGEYVSVSSQADIMRAELKKESKQLQENRAREHRELSSIYVRRGVDGVLANKVAGQLMAHDALGAHARDELGIFTHSKVHPTQAALTSLLSFFIGAALPLLVMLAAPQNRLAPVIFSASIVFLALLGMAGARLGGAPVLRAAMRVTFWGSIAMGLTAAVGNLYGTSAFK